MGYRLSKIYTRTGDDGKTQLAPGQRIAKNHLRIELVGEIDELNSAIGLILAHKPTVNSVSTMLTTIQQHLFDLGGELCPPHRPAITSDKISLLEQHIDLWNEELPPLTEFILPGGNPTAAFCHLARTICRRAERHAVALHEKEKFSAEILRYLNRLSDLLFVAARVLGKESSTDEILWEHQR